MLTPHHFPLLLSGGYFYYNVTPNPKHLGLKTWGGCAMEGSHNRDWDHCTINGCDLPNYL